MSHSPTSSRCLICGSIGGSHPGHWHKATCSMKKAPLQSEALKAETIDKSKDLCYNVFENWESVFKRL